MQRLSRLALLSTMALIVTGCNTIEHRSERVPKYPLPTLSQKKVQSTVIWSSHQGVGSLDKDVKLHLAITPILVVSMDAKGDLRAQNRQTGQLVWKAGTKVVPSSGPTVIHDLILIGTQDSRLQAYRLNNGKLVWEVPVTGEILSMPKSSHNAVYFNTLDGSVVALNIEDGRQLWRYSLNSPSMVLRHSSSPVLTQNHVIAGFANGHLVALNRRDGSVEWEREVSIPKGRSDIQRMSDIAADPAVLNDTVYVVNYQGRLVALSLQTGIPLWEKEMSSYTGFSVGQHDLLVSDVKGHLWSVDRRSGKILWEQAALQGRRLTKPIRWDNRLVVADDEGYLHWLSQSTGAYLDRVRLDSRGIETTPILMDNKLYTLSRSGKIVVYGLQQLTDVCSPEQNSEIPLLKKKILKNQAKKFDPKVASRPLAGE
jgi:outer membrane protein assembly factor BamB